MVLSGSPGEVLAEAERIFLGRYVIDAPLPWNGLAFVFRAVEPGRAVAVAALPADLTGDERGERRFRKAAKHLAEVHHPALLPVTDIGVEHGVPYLESEFVAGRTVAELVAQQGSLGKDLAFAVADAVLGVLEVAHDRRWLHLDLTPTNVLIAGDPQAPRVVVVGLGFRSLLSGAQGARTAVSGEGGERFVPPEVRRGQPDGRSDLFSVGALLFFMVTGKRPPAAGGSARRAGWARSVVERAMAQRSVDRFADARSMRATLCKAHEGQAVALPKRRGAHRAALWAAAAVLCLLSGVGAALGWMRWHEARPATAAQTTAPPATAMAAPEPGPPAPDPVPAPDRADPWAGELPAPLAEAYPRTERHERFSRDELAPLYAYSKAHPDDSRGHLVLARAFADLGWFTPAIQRYEQAADADPEARNDPRMLDDVMPLLGHADLHEAAQRLVTKVYGADAVPRLEAYLEHDELPWVEHRRVLKYVEHLKTRAKKLTVE